MLGHLVQAHSGENTYAVPRASLRRWLDRVMSALLNRRTQ
jgi:hypothetical protein